MADFFKTPHSQSGLAGSHVMGALLAIVLLSLLALDVLTLYSLRVRLQHGLLLAARQASVHQARPEKIAQTFAQGLAAAKVPRHDQWQIQILSPSAQAFTLHGQASEQHAGRMRITQAWQAQQNEQSSHHSPSIYQANTLHLYLLYAHQTGPLSLMRLLPKLPASMPGSIGPASLWLRLEIKYPMQSDPVQWDDLADGRVVYAHQPDISQALPVPKPGHPTDSTTSPPADRQPTLPPWDSVTQPPPSGSQPFKPSPGSSDVSGGAENPNAPDPACF